MKPLYTKCKALTLLFLFTGYVASAQHEMDWVNVPFVENGKSLYMDDMEVDAAGNIYTRQFRHDFLNITPNTNFYKVLVKQDPFGNVLWQKRIGQVWLPQDNAEKLMVQKNNFLYTVVFEDQRLRLFRIEEQTDAMDTVMDVFVTDTNQANYAAGVFRGYNGHIYVYLQIANQNNYSGVFELDDNDVLLHTINFNIASTLWSLGKNTTDYAGNVYTEYVTFINNVYRSHLRKTDTSGVTLVDSIVWIGSGGTTLLALDSNGNSFFWDSLTIKKRDAQFHVLWSYDITGMVACRYRLDVVGNLYLILNDQFGGNYRCVKLRPDGSVAYDHPFPAGRYPWGIDLHVAANGDAMVNGFSFINNGYRSHKQSVALTVIDTAGLEKEFFADTIFYNTFSFLADYNSFTRDNGDVYLAAKFRNPPAHWLQNDTSALDTMKFELWYTIKLCQQCGKNNVTGKVVADTIVNCLVDSLEPAARNTLIHLTPGTRMSLVNTEGNYKFSNVGAGNYEVAVLPPPYLQADCDSLYSFVIDSVTTSARHDFALTLLTGCKMNFTMAAERARVGELQRTDINFYNEMWQPVTGMLAVTLDSMFSFNYASRVPDSASGKTYFWKFNNLGPFEDRDLSIYSDVNADTTFHMGYFHLKAALYADCNNPGIAVVSDTLSDLIFSSFDPNDKQVFPLMVRQYSQFTDKQEPLVYQINFQNTGNDTAWRIVLRDTIDGNLNLNTLKLIAASHPYSFEAGPNRDIAWTFENIGLPDSGANEVMSRGYVKYSIVPNANLALLQTVNNRASIYFDFNSPVQTNNVNLQYVDHFYSSIPSTTTDAAFVNIYPNPASDRLFIETGSMAVTEINLFNATGGLVMSVMNPTVNSGLSISSLPQGVYVAEVKTISIDGLMRDSFRKRWVKM